MEISTSTLFIEGRGKSISRSVHIRFQFICKKDKIYSLNESLGKKILF
jgi:hypothetical protein